MTTNLEDEVDLKSRLCDDQSVNDPTAGTLSVGAVSERTGVAPSALRFYEQRGLIQSTRSDGNQRRYRRDVLRRVSFTRVAQQIGLSLDEIADALSSLPDARTPTERDWQRLATAWGPRLDEQIAVLQRLRDQAAKKDPLAALTEQERHILDLIGEGLTNRQIGERMFLAEKTVKNYVSNLLSKLDMQRRTQAAALAARLRAGRKD